MAGNTCGMILITSLQALRKGIGCSGVIIIRQSSSRHTNGRSVKGCSSLHYSGLTSFCAHNNNQYIRRGPNRKVPGLLASTCRLVSGRLGGLAIPPSVRDVHVVMRRPTLDRYAIDRPIRSGRPIRWKKPGTCTIHVVPINIEEDTDDYDCYRQFVARRPKTTTPTRLYFNVLQLYCQLYCE